MNGQDDATTAADGRDKLLASCRHHWESAGIAPATVGDMLDELRTHLEAAAARGRSATDVVGPDVGAFAREWARARTPRGIRWLRVAVTALGAMLLLTLVRHLVLRDLTVAITPGYAIIMGALILGQLGWSRRQPELTFRQISIVSAIGLAAFLFVELVLLPDQVLFHLPLWVTASLAAGCLALAYWEDRRGSVTRGPETAGPMPSGDRA